MAFLAINPNTFLSTLSLRRATDLIAKELALAAISIHALLAESDLNQIPPRRFHYHFYPRSPCGERPTFMLLLVSILPFLSTLSLRRATCAAAAEMLASWDFYPRSPCGERPAPKKSKKRKRMLFLSTLSLRRATVTDCIPVQQAPISIHALLAESDLASRTR